MNPPTSQKPTAQFLISAISEFFRILLTPAYFIMREHMGIRQGALLSLLLGAVLYSLALSVLAATSEANAVVITVYVLLVLVGYLRNAEQAQRRRRVRDWSVNSWSTGTSLLAPVFIFASRRLVRIWPRKPLAMRIARLAYDQNFIYYVAEPALLVLIAIALISIGSTLYFYTVLVAVGLIVARSEYQLSMYLRAHDIMDGKMMEQAVMGQLAVVPQGAKGGSCVAQIPPAPAKRVPTDPESVFDRLSPELQLLLMRDAVTRP